LKDKTSLIFKNMKKKIGGSIVEKREKEDSSLVSRPARSCTDITMRALSSVIYIVCIA